MQDIRNMTWLLPTATITFVGYLIFAIVGGLTFQLPIWVILGPSIPAIILLWIALIVALVDATKRPKTEMTEEARMIWVLLLCLINVFALLPYWFMVIRRKSQPVS